jgi:hypothetical protein
MMEDFHNSTRCAGETLDVAASVEGEARVTGQVAAPSGSMTPQAPTGGGPSRQAWRLHRQRPEGGCPVGLMYSLSDTATHSPSRWSKDAIAIHATPSHTRPTTRGLHRWR